MDLQTTVGWKLPWVREAYRSQVKRAADKYEQKNTRFAKAQSKLRRSQPMGLVYEFGINDGKPNIFRPLPWYGVVLTTKTQSL